MNALRRCSSSTLRFASSDCVVYTRNLQKLPLRRSYLGAEDSFKTGETNTLNAEFAPAVVKSWKETELWGVVEVT